MPKELVAEETVEKVETPVIENEESDPEDQEWEDAMKEVMGDDIKEEKKEENTEEKIEEKKEEEKIEEKKEEEKIEEKTEEKVEEITTSTVNPSRDVRLAQREAQEASESVRKEVREFLYKDLQTELKDEKGNVIKEVSDVMKYLDERTGEPFTEEAATLWLMQARQALKDNVSEAEGAIDRITAINVRIQDESDIINEKYGQIIKENPEVAQKLWAQYSKTLKMAADGKVITDAPVSLLAFYEAALEPYSKQGTAKAEAEEAKKQLEEANKKLEEFKKASTRNDRSDIYSSGKVDDADDEEKEWKEARKNYYGK